MTKKYYRKNLDNKNKDNSKTNKLLTYLTITLAISQILNIIYSITSNLFGSVDNFLRKFIMYVLLELPLAIIIIYVTIISIACIIKFMHESFLKNKYELISITQNDNKKILKEVVKKSRAEILMIYALPISTYVSIESIIYSYHFQETLFIIWFLIISMLTILMPLIFSIICDTQENIIYFSDNNNSFHRQVNRLFYKAKKFGLPYKVLYILPLLLNILLICFIKIIDIHFTNYENELNIEKRIADDNEIKYEIIIDRLLDKVGINVTDEDIEQYKKELKEKYKMEE